MTRHLFFRLVTRPASAALAAVALWPQVAVARATPVIPAQLSVGGMFLQADWIIKLVMIGLAIASIITWTIFVAKTAQLRRTGASQREAARAIDGLRSLDDAAREPLARDHGLTREALTEFELSSAALSDPEGVKERIVSRFERFEVAEARRLTSGIAVLATIGATAPFVGLFGTVWGIMNSFVGIAEKQTTNLAVVAPGIAESLLATAMGLVAAIPAVVIYNHFSRQIAQHRALIADTAAALLRLASRDLSRRMGGAG